MWGTLGYGSKRAETATCGISRDGRDTFQNSTGSRGIPCRAIPCQETVTCGIYRVGRDTVQNHTGSRGYRAMWEPLCAVWDNRAISMWNTVPCGIPCHLHVGCRAVWDTVPRRTCRRQRSPPVPTRASHVHLACFAVTELLSLAIGVHRPCLLTVFGVAGGTSVTVGGHRWRVLTVIGVAVGGVRRQVPVAVQGNANGAQRSRFAARPLLGGSLASLVPCLVALALLVPLVVDHALIFVSLLHQIPYRAMSVGSMHRMLIRYSECTQF